MRGYQCAVSGLSLALCLQLACAHVDTTIERNSVGSQLSASTEEIKIFRETKPPAGFAVLGKIESHIRRNVFWGGVARLDDEGYKELRRQARTMGGNAVVIDDVLETKAAESTHVHIWATVIRIQ